MSSDRQPVIFGRLLVLFEEDGEEMPFQHHHTKRSESEEKKNFTRRYIYNFIGIEKTSLLSYMSNVSMHDDIGDKTEENENKERKIVHASCCGYV